MQNLNPGNIGLAGGLFIAGGFLAFMDESLAFPKSLTQAANQILTLGANNSEFQQDLGKVLILAGLGVAAAQVNKMS